MYIRKYLNNKVERSRSIYDDKIYQIKTIKQGYEMKINQYENTILSLENEI